MTTERPFTLLPLCGSVEPDYEPFEYFVVRAYGFGVDITSPSTVSLCYMLQEFDVVHLHLPFNKGEAFVSKGMVQSITTHPVTQERTYRLNFVGEAPRPYPFRITVDKEHMARFETDSPQVQLFRDSIKESLLLEKGVAVYLKHLAAYFSQLVGSQHDSYPAFSSFFFDDISSKLRVRVNKLQRVHDDLESDPKQAGLYLSRGFEEIQELVSPAGVNINLLNLAFQEGDHLPYIIAIKELEEKLYWHYNTLVLLYDPAIREKSTHLFESLQKRIEEASVVKEQEKS